MTQKQESTVKWFQLNNIVPIAFTFIMGTIAISAFFYAIRGQVDLLNQKLEFVIQKQNEMLEILSNANTTLLDHEKRIQRLEDTR